MRSIGVMSSSMAGGSEPRNANVFKGKEDEKLMNSNALMVMSTLFLQLNIHALSRFNHPFQFNFNKVNKYYGRSK